MQSFPKRVLLNQLSTYPVVGPHVLLSNPKEVLQRSLPTCSETHSSVELSMLHNCNARTQTALVVRRSLALLGLSARQSTQS